MPWEAGATPIRHRDRDEIWKTKCFNNVCKGKTQQKRVRDKPVENDKQEESPPRKKTRFAEKVAERAVCVSNNLVPKLRWTKSSLIDAVSGLIGTGRVEVFVQSILEHDGPIQFEGVTYETEASIYKLYNEHGFTGLPPGKDKQWSKEALCNSLSGVEVKKGIKMQYLKLKVVESGTSAYEYVGDITKMYNKWKASGQTQSRRRPTAATLDDVCDGIQELIRQGTGDSNTISHKDIGKVLEKVLRKKAEADGLDPKTVDAAVSQRTSRRYLIAAAMKGCGNNDDDINCKLSTKTLRDKNLTRWIAENNVMPALSNAATCITTHAIEGKRPLEIGGPIDYDSLSDEVRETFDLTGGIKR